ncbi:hypothetical protein NDI85_17825 [Halomicroarcula sp. S1AR25-4]|uniref:hypothetical protein n=1 Tax=Haloarcula sp. S1AR25-4 TaxID=2950538 RepID=UPI002874D243|nr:hypothetical protein [Halomicroarcula sp. S1AR25-4]MDS0279657.1 hypothetical protein [Halomicroarcula sp. S1AR25-4]
MFLVLGYAIREQKVPSRVFEIEFVPHRTVITGEKDQQREEKIIGNLLIHWGIISFLFVVINEAIDQVVVLIQILVVVAGLDGLRAILKIRLTAE